jgi:hypothetical protein
MVQAETTCNTSTCVAMRYGLLLRVQQVLQRIVTNQNVAHYHSPQKAPGLQQAHIHIHIHIHIHNHNYH